MDTLFCYVCLSTDRKLSKLGQYTRIFELIITDIQDSLIDPLSLENIHICWECKSILKNVSNLITNLWKSHCSLEACYEKQQSTTLTTLSKASVNSLHYEMISFNDDRTHCESHLSHVKIENDFRQVKSDDGIQYLTEESNLNVNYDNLLVEPLPQADDLVNIDWDLEFVKLEEELPIVKLKQNKKSTKKHKKINLKLTINEKKQKTILPKAQKTRQHDAKLNVVYNFKKVTSVRKKSRNVVKELDHSDKFVFARMTEEEMWLAREEYGKRDLFVNWKYKCYSCLILLHNQHKVNEHMKKHENQPNCEKCHVCSTYLPKNKIKMHTLAHYHKYQCLHCEYTVPFDSRAMWKHYWNHHAEKKTLQCTECPDVFNSMHLYKHHIRTCHQAKMKCKKCGLAFVMLNNYKKHMKIHEKYPVYHCEICKKDYKTRNSLNSHKRVHAVTKPGDAYCAECGLSFKCVARYKAHLKASLKHANKDDPKFICLECHKVFLKKHLLSTHIKRVHQQRSFSCSYCQKVYKKALTLRHHIEEIHLGKAAPRDKICDICDKGFKLQSTLNSHKRTHTGERPFQCPHCPLKFGHKSVLYMHKRLVHKIGAKSNKS